MSFNPALLQELRDTYAGVFQELNAEGVNLQADRPAQLVTYALTGRDKHRGDPGTETVLGTPIDLIVTSLELKNAKSWANGQNEQIGDARMTIAQSGVTEEQLRSLDLTQNQRRYYLLDGERYTLVNGSLEDLNRLEWRMVLKKVKT